MREKRLFLILSYLLLFLAFYLFLKILLPFVASLFWAVIFVVAFYPVNRALKVLLRGRKGVSAGICTLMVVLLIVIPLLFLTTLLARELSQAYQYFENLIESGAFAKMIEELEDLKLIQRLLELLSNGNQPPQLEDALVILGQKITRFLASQTTLLVKKVSLGVVQFLVMLVAIFYLLRDGDLLLEKLKEVLPLEKGEKEELIRRIHEMIIASLYGNVLVAMVQGSLGGIGFWIVGLPSPILWGSVMALLSLLPVVGAYLVWIPASLWLFFGQGELWKALFLAGWGVLVVSTVDNFLRPIFISERVKVHPLLLFFAILGGIKAFGILGVVAAPVIVAFSLAIFDFYIKRPKPSQPGTE